MGYLMAGSIVTTYSLTEFPAIGACCHRNIKH